VEEQYDNRHQIAECGGKAHAEHAFFEHQSVEEIACDIQESHGSDRNDDAVSVTVKAHQGVKFK